MILLLAVYILNFLDRQIVNILAEPIRKDLGLADWQLGLMSGTAFALFYSLAGIPIARQAERRNRPAIIALATACWSGFTILCGFANSFWQMLLFRFGVGIGEAGGVPPSHSLISDYVPRERRAAALAFFHMGLPIGALCGLALGGIVADAHGWRAAFVVAGLPGLIVALAIFFLLPEPRSQLTPSRELQDEARAVGLQETFRLLFAKRTFRLFLIGATLVSFVTYAHQAFVAPFFFRVHGPALSALAKDFALGPAGLLGISLGLTTGFAGSIGLWLGGRISDRMALRNAGAYGRVTAFSLLVFVPVQIGAFLLPDMRWALLAFAPSILLASVWIGPVQATVQSVAPRHMRATASAILLLAINLLGLGLGPLLLGIVSDALSNHADFGPAQGVRWALVLFTLPALLAAALFNSAASSIEADIEG
jgi:MFS family permease